MEQLPVDLLELFLRFGGVRPVIPDGLLQQRDREDVDFILQVGRRLVHQRLLPLGVGLRRQGGQPGNQQQQDAAGRHEDSLASFHIYAP